jgi:DNA-binding NarL/FixJ family response regulator
MKLMRILLADDHALVRAAIRALLDALPAVEVVAESAGPTSRSSAIWVPPSLAEQMSEPQ